MDDICVEEFQVCESCGQRFSVTKGEIDFGPDPYSEEINGDSTPLWQCNNCSYESAQDI